ncbi:MAG TPA: hypothetical protein VMA72_02845 [Streptosporangiaceae bacterium]|nr:hypothetical protein [Streptosporangiaceae bacterium]
MDLLRSPTPADLGPTVVARTGPWLVPLANRLPPGDLGPDDVRVIHLIADFVKARARASVVAGPAWSRADIGRKGALRE